MISIVISEKGGAERRDVFSQDEITIGRVKGNDVLLAKGNVSKQHARVIVRDGRYIVTDLKSTNGTYVNHRRITHATLVREGDRIYVGDFILRIENPLGAEATPHDAPSSIPASPGAPADDLAASMLDPATASGIGSSLSPAARTGSYAPVFPSSHNSDDEIVSHFPLENDPDADDAGLPFEVPGPPRVPGGLHPAPNAPTLRGTREAPPRDVVPSTASSSGIPSSSTGSFPAVAATSVPENGSVPQPLSSESTPSTRTSELAADEARRTAQRAIVAELIEHVERAIERAKLDALPRPDGSVVRHVEELLSSAAGSLNVAPDVDVAAVLEIAKRELVGLGPLDALVDDESVTRIRVTQREVHLQRRGQPSAHEGHGFATERGLVRAIERLCADSGKPLTSDETVVERELSDGRKLSALLAPAALDGAVLQLRRVRSEPVTLNALVRGGAVSRGMAMLLSHSMAARANVLIVGAPGHGGEEVVSALCICTPRSHHVLTLGDDDFGGRAVRLATRIEDGKLTELVRAAARMAPDHLLARALGGEPLAALLDTVAEGQAGVVFANPATTLRQAIERMATDVANTRALSLATSRDWMCNAFDLAIEVSRLKDGRLRVLRIAELKGSAPRDIFTFTYHRTAAGGAIEGSFAASGVIPRIVEDLAARGMPLDTAIFRRHPTG